MGETPRTFKVYIVSQTSLFAQGMRSLLRGEQSIEILGVESDQAKAIEALRSVHPDVVIVETSNEESEFSTFGVILRAQTSGRVVALDLKHNHATIYNRQRIHSVRMQDLLKAIHGEARP